MNVASETNIDAFGDLELAVGHLLDTVTVWYGVQMCSLNKYDNVNNCGIRICSQIKGACVVILNFQLLEELDNDVNLK